MHAQSNDEALVDKPLRSEGKVACEGSFGALSPHYTPQVAHATSMMMRVMMAMMVMRVYHAMGSPDVPPIADFCHSGKQILN